MDFDLFFLMSCLWECNFLTCLDLLTGHLHKKEKENGVESQFFLLRGFKHAGLKYLRWVLMENSELWCQGSLLCAQLTVKVTSFYFEVVWSVQAYFLRHTIQIWIWYYSLTSFVLEVPDIYWFNIGLNAVLCWAQWIVLILAVIGIVMSHKARIIIFHKSKNNF